MIKKLALLTCLLMACLTTVLFTGCGEHTHKLTKHQAVSATCTKEGNVEYYSCECGLYFEDSEGKVITYKNSWVTPITEHDITEYVYNNDATCTQAGTKTATCKNCDWTETVIVQGTKLNHKFVNYVYNEDATCEWDGTKTATCEDCTAKNVVVVAGTMLPHNYDEGKITTPVTSTTSGIRTYTCADCQDTYTEIVEAIPDGVFVADLSELTTAFANGGTIVLEDDVFTSSMISLAKGKDVVLDLNGYTLSAAFINTGASAVIKNSGSLTIKNGTIISLAEYPDVDWDPEGFPTYATNTISNSGVLVVEEGTVIENQTSGGASYAIDNYAGATLTVNGGLIKAKNVAIRINTASATAENNVVINGGTITGVRAIWIHLAGSKSTVAPKVNLTITGGKFSCTKADGFVIYSYSYGNSYANTNVTISGGEYLNGWVAFGGGYKGDRETVSVTGGLFEYDVFRYITNDGIEYIKKANI